MTGARFMKTAWPAALAILFAAEPASAQIFTKAGVGHAALQQKTASERARILAGLVEQANKEACKPATAAFRGTAKDGGFWYLKCTSGREFMVTMPASADKGGVAMSCMLSKAIAGRDCHAH